MLSKNASDGDTIRLTADITMADHPPHIDKRITVEGAGHSISGDDQYRVFVVAEGGVLTINDLTLANGRAQDGDPECVSGRDWSDEVGGAICNNGRLTISDSSFSGNSAHSGGAIVNSGEASISGSGFNDNSAPLGGAIVNSGEASISGSSFSGNFAESYGGAIINDGEAIITISDSSFSGNSADAAGGAIANDGEARINDSSFSGNSAEFGGGAILNWGEASISDSSFSGNSADYGGALWLIGTATLSNLTLSGNDADESGGGIFVYYEAKSVSLRNSILADNEGGDCVNEIDLTESLNNIIKDGSCLDDTGIQADPMLGDWVEATGTTTGYFPLLEGSPAIDAAAESACADTDQLGNARPHGKGCDIGAIESPYAASLEPEPEPASDEPPADDDAPSASDAPDADFLVSSYNELVDAIENASDGDTIRLTADITMRRDPAEVTKQITVEGAGHSISGNEQYRIFFVAESGDLTIKDLTLTKGRAQDGDPECGEGKSWGDEAGGAICNNGKLTISDSSFSRNNASISGGAIVNFGEASISGSSFSGNSARYGGGAIDNGGEASLSISDSSFSGNSAGDVGGAIVNNGEASISGSSFSGNSARYGGGAISNWDEASLGIIGSSFSGNSTDSRGGALELYGTATLLSNLTLSGNTADESGGGIFVTRYAGSVSLRNSILADNEGGDCVNEIDLDESLNNIIKDGSCLDDTGIQADPMLGDWVEATYTTTGYFPLLEGSPAIDAAAESACSETDQLGNARPYGSACDIGAIEFLGEPETLGRDPEPASDVTPADAVPPEVLFFASSYDEMANAIQSAISGDTIRLTADITMTDHPPPIVKRVTIEGDGHTISGNDQYRIFFVAERGDLTIKDLTLTKGRAQDGDPECVPGRDWTDELGGAICNIGTVTISDSSFSGNSAWNGGAISNGGQASIGGSSFSNNNTARDGGAIYNYGEANISGSSFSGNSAEWDGGAIHNQGEANISDGSFSGNSAGDDGGAIYNDDEARLSISDSSFSGNSVEEIGGAIFNDDGASISISDSSISDNSARNGGAIYNAGRASISGSSVSGNSARKWGGAIANEVGAPLSISTSSFHGNSAGEQGGAMFLYGKATLSNLTVSGNTGNDSGGGISVPYHVYSSISIRNSILADNEGGDCVNEIDLAESLNNIIKDGSCLDNTGIQADPMLGDWVEATDSTTGYFPLLEGSPAIDAAAESACSETDQLGNARPHGNGCDIGAIEFQGEPDAPSPEPEPADDDAPSASDAPEADFWVSSYGELTKAIRNASDGDTIRLTGDITMSDHPPQIDKQITVDGAGHTISGDDQYRIFFVTEDGDLTINDLTLTKGRAQDGDPECRRADNDSDRDGFDEVGGAICNLGKLTVTGSSFRDNSAEVGGAIFYLGEASISDSSFSGNSADAVGGAIASDGEARITISESSFSGNSAKYGGAISNWGEASISESSFSANSAGESGGAIVNHGEASISGSIFSGNSAKYGGAIVNHGEASIIGSSFSGNSANDGGAISNSGEASISESSFSANSADEGGALWLFDNATLSNLTLSGNTADESGGGIFLFEYADSVRIRNSILADNEGGDCVNQIDLAESLNNIIKDGSCLDDTGIQADPMLGDWVEATETTTGHFPLLEGSPAIDAAAESACSETDQLGNARPHGKGCDIGAIESPFAAIAEPEPEPASEEPPADDDAPATSDAPEADVWVSSYDELVDAIANASDGDTIRLYSGISMSGHPPPINKQITVEGYGATITGNEKYRIFVVAAGGDLTINNLKLTSGWAREGNASWGREGSPVCIAGKGWTDEVGGAICNNGTLTINDSSFSDNRSFGSAGGAIFNYDGELSISRSSFNDSSADYGGAIYNNGEASVSGSSFSGNTADNSAGAIYNDGEASLNISDSSFDDNSADREGGAIISFGDVSISGSRFDGNYADRIGGAIYIYNSGEATISNSSFGGNSADKRYGGAIYNAGAVRISGSSFRSNSADYGGGRNSGNHAWDRGGAIYNSGEASISGSSFRSNSAKDGGAIANYGEASVRDSSFSGNTAVYGGGAIDARGGSVLMLSNVTIAATRDGRAAAYS